VHADAPTAEATDWAQIIALYDQLYSLRPTLLLPEPLGGRRRASRPCRGARRARAIAAGTLDTYQHTTRARRPSRTSGSPHEALGAYDRAIELTTNAVERAFLVRNGRPVSRPPPNFLTLDADWEFPFAEKVTGEQVAAETERNH